MDYRVFSMTDGEEENSTEAHVFARAYRSAWRSVHGSEPAGRHEVAGLGLIFDFGARASAQVGSPTARRIEPASTTVDVPPGGRHDH